MNETETTTRNNAIICDHRKDQTQKPRLMLCATDRFMSGWGKCPGTSYVAYDITGQPSEIITRLETWMSGRSDFMRVRVNLHLPRLSTGDHCSIYDVPYWMTGNVTE